MTSPHAAPAVDNATMADTGSINNPQNKNFTAADDTIGSATHSTTPSTGEELKNSATEPEVALGGPQPSPAYTPFSAQFDAPDGVRQVSIQEDNSATAFPLGMTAPSMSQSALPYDLARGFDFSPFTPDMGSSNYAVQSMNTLNDTPNLREADPSRIQAYAKLQFADGVHFVNTHSLILGRDVQAAKAALRREAEERKEAQQAASGAPRTPSRKKKDGSKLSRSIVSGPGGVIKRGDDSDTNKGTDKNRPKSESTGSSARRREPGMSPSVKVEYKPQVDLNAKPYLPDSAAAVRVDPGALRPSADHCPLIPIHPSANQPASAYKSLSRQHLKIAYNPRTNKWEARVMGRNGAFVDDNFYQRGTSAVLDHGSNIVLGAVSVDFSLPNTVAPEPNNDLAYHEDSDLNDGWVQDVDGVISPQGAKISKQFVERRHSITNTEYSEDDSDVSVGVDTQNSEPDPSTELTFTGFATRPSDFQDDEEDPYGTDDPGEDVSMTDDGNVNSDEQGNEEGGEVRQPSPVPVRRKGPGRPPKNGIMSKREENELKKKREAEEQAKNAESSTKKKVGRPKKNPLPDEPPVKTEKRKYTKRKPKDPDAVRQEGSEEDGKPSKEKKDKRPARAPRSPSPTFNEEELTSEQLAKPTQNYVELIAEAIAAREGGKMSLPQIYRAIMRKYPYFVLKCGTNGWQSSVRHNLSQHPAFTKAERDGKGWTWMLVPGVPTGKEKKQRQRSPPPQGSMHPQPIYSTPQHGMMPGQAGMMAPPPGYPMNGQMPPHHMPGQHPQYRGPPTNGFPVPHMHQQYHGQQPPYSGPPPPPQPMVRNAPTYQSPYDPPPPQNENRFHPPPGPPPPGPPPQMPPQLNRPSSQQQGPPQLEINDNIRRAIESFRSTVISGISVNAPNAEAIVASAVNRVLGISTSSVVGGNESMELKVMTGLKGVITKIAGGPELLAAAEQRALYPAQPPMPNMQASNQGQGISRPNGVPISVPRPSMTHSMARTNSGTHINRLGGASASPRLGPGAGNISSGPPQPSIPLSSASPAPFATEAVTSPALPQAMTSLTPHSMGESPAPSSEVVPSSTGTQGPSVTHNVNGKRQRSEDEHDITQPESKRQESGDEMDICEQENKQLKPLEELQTTSVMLAEDNV